ncbi:MAG: Sua5 family C-terminal domain-containing protein, partial [Spirochaetota bacterium]
ADEKGCARIYAELPPARGIGRALRDRILRASGFANS